MRKPTLLAGGLATGVILALSLAGVLLAATVGNGNFETGDLSGWTSVNTGSGGWSAYTGTISPLSGRSIAAPPEGTNAATTDSTGPGSHILYQDIALEAGSPHFLSFEVYYVNEWPTFHTPDTLDHNVIPNQQYRVDVLDPAEPVDSLAVLASVFRTQVGDPLTLAPTLIVYDLSGFAGSTVRIRFAEVDNRSFFRAPVDDVKLVAAPPPPPPEPEEFAVDIDVKPGKAKNKIKLHKNEKVKVAILSSNEFDATTEVARDSLTFGQTGDEDSLIKCNKKGKDKNGDGLKDLVCTFDVDDTELEVGDTVAFLKGETIDSTPIEGSDSVIVKEKDEDKDDD